MKILLTGGAGYIGSHTAATLVTEGFQPVVLDNFANSHPVVMDRLAQVCGTPVPLERGDVLDTPWLTQVLLRHQPAAVVHFAGDKAVGESVAQPLKYFHNNIGGAVSLMRALEQATTEAAWPRPPALVFSSSATVYGDPASVPITEDFPRSHTNPYGHTKLVIEDMLAAQCLARPEWLVGVLRYFNPVGAHPSGLMGEDPDGPPNNLMPYVTQVAIGRRPCLSVYGDDYPTPDGTGVRDYIHVMDLAAGHVAAVRALLRRHEGFTVNLGTGRGHSVLDVVKAFERVSGRPVPYRIAPRRSGDVAQCWADPGQAQALLGWQASRGLDEMCADAWRWQSQNPQGYRGA
ncbi:MAG: UDP-glucose 4-epimerase GalE [Burkholderiaceae bacterium]